MTGIACSQVAELPHVGRPLPIAELPHVGERTRLATELDPPRSRVPS
jgi:hypothetical protein